VSVAKFESSLNQSISNLLEPIRVLYIHDAMACPLMSSFPVPVVCGCDSVHESRTGNKCLDVAYTSCYLGLHSHMVHLPRHIQVSTVLGCIFPNPHIVPRREEPL
jgi:hypothetical protein